MSETRPAAPRPSVVTLSCVFIAVTAFLTLTELVSALMNWGTVDMQDAITPVLRQMRGAGVDLTLAGLLGLLRWMALGMVVFVVATLVFALYALRGDRPARVWTSVLAVGAGVLSLPLGAFGFLQAAMLFFAAGALWTPDARRWYGGEAVATAVAGALDGMPEPPVAGPPSAATPPSAVNTSSAVAPVGRPASVLAAGLVTILGSVAAAGFALIYLAVYTFARQAYIEEVNSGPFKDLISPADLELAMRVTLWVSVGVLPLAVAGLVGAIALLARRPVGRVATLAWAWVASGIGLVLFPVGLLATAGAGTVILLLLRDDARAWTAVRK